jgi:hypothetical protein
MNLMFKRCVAYLLIASFLLMDVASCMQGDDEKQPLLRPSPPKQSEVAYGATRSGPIPSPREMQPMGSSAVAPASLKPSNSGSSTDSVPSKTRSLSSSPHKDGQSAEGGRHPSSSPPREGQESDEAAKLARDAQEDSASGGTPPRSRSASPRKEDHKDKPHRSHSVKIVSDGTLAEVSLVDEDEPLVDARPAAPLSWGDLPWWPVERKYRLKSTDVPLQLTEDQLRQLTPVRGPATLDADLEAAHPVMAFLKSLPKETKTYLSRFAHQIIEGKSTKSQKLAMAAGVLVGMGLSAAMMPVYNGGIIYLRDRYRNTIVENLTEYDWNYALAYILLTTLPDAIPRNVGLWKRAATSFQAGVKDKGRVTLLALASIIPSLLPPSYLIQFEQYVATKTAGQTFASMFTYCPPLFADAFAGNYEMLEDMGGEAKECWEKLRKKLPSSLSSWSFPKSPPSSDEESDDATSSISASPIEDIRKSFSAKLGALSEALFRLPEAEIAPLYDKISELKRDVATQFPDLQGEDLASYQSLLALRYLIGLGGQVEEPEETIPSLYEEISDTFTTSCLVLGSPARLLVLEATIENLFGLFAPPLVSRALGWILGALGFPIQTRLEYEGMKGLFRNFLWEETAHGHSSHPSLRIAAKLNCALQGLIFTLPLIVYTLQICDGWELNNWWMIGSIPFVIPELAAQTTYFNYTYNRGVATAATDIHNWWAQKKGQPPRTDWRKDQLLQMIQAAHQDLKNMDPSLLANLEASLFIKGADILATDERVASF